MVIILGGRKAISVSSQLYSELETIKNICNYKSFGAVIEDMMPNMKKLVAQVILSRQMDLIEAFGHDPIELISNLDTEIAVKNFDMINQTYSNRSATE